MATGLLGLGAIFFTPLAASQPAEAAVCMKHDYLVSFLSEKHSEAPRALGLVADRGLMEVYVSHSGTWTIVMTTTQGVACIIAAGDTWEEQEITASIHPEF